MRVLIVDDNPINLKVLKAGLQAEGITVIEALDGLQALEILAMDEVDAVISDILMPKMDGYRLCNRVRSDERFKELPFIIYSMTYLSESDEKLALEVGADKFLRKPAPIPAILSVLRELLNRSRRAVLQSPALTENQVLKEYNETLIRKLEEKNAELQVKGEDLERTVVERTAQLETAIRDIDSFSYSVSHDLRAPLRSIGGFSLSLLEDCSDQLSEEGKGYLHRICSAVRQMDQLIEALLSFAHLGRKEIHKSMIDLIPLIQSVAKEEREKQAREVEITIQKLPPAYGDPTLIRQIFVNLISNAVKYTRYQSRPVIEIGADFKDGEQVYHVKDNGAGFDMQYADKLFGVFQRLHKSEDFEGTGIGLALVKQIVTRHGGRVWAEGKTGLGATIYFTLPVISFSS